MTESARSLLVNVLLEAEGAELESVECTAVPSPSFSRRIERIAAHPEKYSKRRVKKRFIFLIAAALILTGCAAIKPVRTKIANFIVTVFEKGSDIDPSAGKNAKSVITEFYTPAFIPDGYVLVDEKAEKFDDGRVYYRDLTYQSGNKIIRFAQMPAKDAISIDTENAEITTVTVNGADCMCIKKTDRVFVVWEKDGYRFILTIYDDLPDITITKIVEKVKSD